MDSSRSRRRAPLAATLVAIVVFAAAGVAIADSGVLSPSVPILDMEVEPFAAEMAVDLETARAMLQAQQVLSDFADTARLNPWYSGFKLINEPPNVRAVLAVTDPNAVVIPDGLPVTVVTARISEKDMTEFHAFHVKLLKEALPTVEAVTYDPTSDTISIWASEADLTAEDKAAIVDLLAAASPDVFDSAEVIFQIGQTGWFGFTGPPR